MARVQQLFSTCVFLYYEMKLSVLPAELDTFNHTVLPSWSGFNAPPPSSPNTHTHIDMHLSSNLFLLCLHSHAPMQILHFHNSDQTHCFSPLEKKQNPDLQNSLCALPHFWLWIHVQTSLWKQQQTQLAILSQQKRWSRPSPPNKVILESCLQVYELYKDTFF